jgi:SERRATE/Ars2, N-terminal domain
MKGHETYRSKRPSDRPTSQRHLDPYTLDHIVPFTYFCDWYKRANARTLSRNTDINKELQESFIKYKEDLLARTAKRFVRDHILEEWFREKYDPTVSPAVRIKLVNYRKWLYEKFMQDLDGGTLDDWTFDGDDGMPSLLI